MIFSVSPQVQSTSPVIVVGPRNPWYSWLTGGIGQALRSMWKNYISFSGAQIEHGDLQRLNK